MNSMTGADVTRPERRALSESPVIGERRSGRVLSSAAIETMTSWPPISRPATYTCGYVGQEE